MHVFYSVILILFAGSSTAENELSSVSNSSNNCFLRPGVKFGSAEEKVLTNFKNYTIKGESTGFADNHSKTVEQANINPREELEFTFIHKKLAEFEERFYFKNRQDAEKYWNEKINTLNKRCGKPQYFQKPRQSGPRKGGHVKWKLGKNGGIHALFLEHLGPEVFYGDPKGLDFDKTETWVIYVRSAPKIPQSWGQ